VTPDVKVLVAATRGDHRQHASALRWFNESVTAATPAAPFTLLPMVVVGYARVVTNRRIFSVPTPTAEALATIAALLAAPHVRLAATRDEWPRVSDLCERHGLAGDVITDAWIAASVLQLDELLVTFDRGFRRFLASRHLTVLQP
jgi:uncharacterized protein